MHVIPSGLIVNNKQSDQNPIRLEVEFSFSNGRAVFRDIVINPASGEILSVKVPGYMQPSALFGSQLEKLARTLEAHGTKVAALLA